MLAVIGSGDCAILPFCCKIADNFFAAITTFDILLELSAFPERQWHHKVKWNKEKEDFFLIFDEKLCDLTLIFLKMMLKQNHNKNYGTE